MSKKKLGVIKSKKKEYCQAGMTGRQIKFSHNIVKKEKYQYLCKDQSLFHSDLITSENKEFGRTNTLTFHPNKTCNRKN